MRTSTWTGVPASSTCSCTGSKPRRRPPAVPAGGREAGPAARGPARPRPGCGCPPGQGGARPPARSRSQAATPSPRRAGSTSPPRAAAPPSAARVVGEPPDPGNTPRRSAPTPSGPPRTPAAHPAGAQPAIPAAARPTPRHGAARRTAAMPAAVQRLQRQVRQRHQPLGHQQRVTQLKPRVRPAGRTAVQRGAEALHHRQPLAPSIRPAHTSTSGHHAPPSTWSYSGTSRGGRPTSTRTHPPG
jgi:hypothetical protein